MRMDFESYLSGVENIRRLKLGQEAADLILGENLRRIYGL